jgi:hypothetical protein
LIRNYSNGAKEKGTSFLPQKRERAWDEIFFIEEVYFHGEISSGEKVTFVGGKSPGSRTVPNVGTFEFSNRNPASTGSDFTFTGSKADKRKRR